MDNMYPIFIISVIVILLNSLTNLPIWGSALIGGVIGFFIYLAQDRYFKK